MLDGGQYLREYDYHQQSKRMTRNKEIEEILRKLKNDVCFSNPYFPYSQYPNYLFVYITYHYGWSIHPPCTMLFLYDEIDNVLKCASCSDFVFEEIGSSTPEPRLSIKNLFTVVDQVQSSIIYDICDASTYYLYMKSDNIEKKFTIYHEFRKNYAPFEPILKIVDIQRKKELLGKDELRVNNRLSE